MLTRSPGRAEKTVLWEAGQQAQHCHWPAVQLWARRLSSLSSSMCACVLSRVQLSATLWTSHQTPLSMEFSRQEYWRGLPFPIPGDLPDPGVEPRSLVSPALAGRFFTTAPTGKLLARWLSGKESACQCRGRKKRGLASWVAKVP